MVVAPGRRAWRALLHRSSRMTAREAARAGPWLVLAPHPDDETLGAGALIAAIAAGGAAAHVAFLTDGSGSHAGAPGWGPARIAGVRRQEAEAALHALGAPAPRLRIGWRDAAPPAPGDPAFERGVRRLVAWCRRLAIRRIAVTLEAERHCDHEAAARLAVEAARRCRARVHFYCVWGWADPDLEGHLRGLAATAIDTAAFRSRQRRALNCHRSQRGGRIAGARESFRLPRSMLRLVDAPRTILLETRHAA